MRLVKENIHLNKILNNNSAQIRINEEVMLPEENQPIHTVIKENARCQIEGVRVRDEQVVIQGYLSYSVLYCGNELEKINGYQGEIPFEETVRMPGVKEECDVKVNSNIDAISIRRVNGGKIIVKADISVFATAEKSMEKEAVSGIDDNQGVFEKKKQLEMMNLVADKVDTFRIKEDINIPSEKPEIYKIVWSDVKLKSVSTKIMDKMMHIGGEVAVFVIYLADSDNMTQQWYETTVPFGGTIDILEAKEDSVSYVNCEIQSATLEILANEVFENREITTDVLLNLQIKLYEEKEIEIIDDIYSTKCKLIPEYEKGEYHKLLIKNSSREKKVVKVEIDRNKGNVLQLCDVGANIKVNDISIVENGLQVQGKIKAYLLYVTADDNEPICNVEKEIDFSHKIDAEGISKDDEYYINWRMEQVVANMISTEEIEIKSVLVLDTIVFKNCSERIIVGVQEQESDYHELTKIPTIKGYVVQDGDDLWNIAKANHTTIENIKEINGLKSEQINRGDRLLIAKKVSK